MNFNRHSLFRSFASVISIASLSAAAVPAAHAQNLAINGDFSAGNTGFSTDYTLVPTDGSVFTNPPDYAVVSNPSTAFPANGFGSYGDHTTGSGFMLFGDGASSSSTRLWYETLNLASNTTYSVSFWGANAGSGSPAVLQFFAGGNHIGTDLTVTTTPGQWVQYNGSFNSGAGGSTVVSLDDGNTAFSFNDFTVDDIRVIQSASSAPEPGSLGLSLMALAGFATLRRKKPWLGDS